MAAPEPVRTEAAMSDRTVPRRWARVVATRPDAVAVATPDGSLTFAELDAAARHLAATLAGPANPVAVLVDAFAASFAAIMGVLLSGRPLVVLDPALPEDRRATILARSGAVMLPDSAAAADAAGIALPEPRPHDPAILVFTSGSTGEPKGVVHPHENWINQADEARIAFGLSPADGVGMLLPASFGAGLDVVLMALLNGAALHHWDPRTEGLDGLAQWLSRTGATTLHCTPSFLRTFVAHLGRTGSTAAAPALPGLRLVTTCGEPVHGDDVRSLRPHLAPDAVFASWSGSSETGHLAFNPFPPDRPLPDGVVPVGRPAANKTVTVVGDDGAALGPGEVGRVVVTSRFVAAGYLGDIAGTLSRFTAAPGGARAYRMGDLGRIDDGVLHLLGRSDDGIKIRGYLVEPAEVEAALRSLEWVVDAAVVADRSGDEPHLVGYVGTDADRWSPSPAEVRGALSERLPGWMVPRRIVVLAELPRTERGKVDRRNLPAPPPPPPRVRLRGTTEAALGRIWCRVLSLPEVGSNEDFTELGGDSLAAVTMLREVAETFLVEIAPSQFAQAPTVAGLAALVDDAAAGRRRTDASALVSLRESGSRTPLFLVAGGGAPAASLLPLVRALPDDVPVYGLQAHGLENRGVADRSVRANARRFVRLIREVFPHGPYRLGGHSIGGLIALEMAVLLEADGDRVDVVFGLDPLLEPSIVAHLTGTRARRVRTPRTGALPARQRAEGPATAKPRLERIQAAVVLHALMLTAGTVRLPASVQWTVFWELSSRFVRRHRPTPWAGRVHLIRARDNTDPDAAWRLLAAGDLRCHTVGGDHHSMIRQAHVTETAAVIAAGLDELDRTGPGPVAKGTA